MSKFVHVDRWNTGRLYDSDGQWIAAGMKKDGTVVFADDTRCIGGQILRPYPLRVPKDDHDAWLFRDFVMSQYDCSHGYESGSFDDELMNMHREQ